MNKFSPSSNSNSNSNSSGSFLNGRAQVVELLQLMRPEEKTALLKTIKSKNPQLAYELSKESLSFLQIEKLADHEIRLLFSYIQASILGVALKGVPPSLQKRVLSLAPKSYAEEAYGIMISPLRDENSGIKRAQGKILGIILDLYQKRQINFL